MTVRYRTLVSVESNGETYRAQSLSGTEAEAVMKMSTEVEGTSDDVAAGIAGLHIAAFVTGRCLLNGEDATAFERPADETHDQLIARVMDEIPAHLMQAVFKACMDDAGLGEEETSGN